MTCDGLELSASTLALELEAAPPALSLSAAGPSLSLAADGCELTLTIDSTLAFSVTTQSLELVAQTTELCISTPIPVSTGEANTASNCGAAGVGLFHQKVGVDLEFRNIRSTSAALDVALNPTDCTVDLTVNPGAFDRYNIEPTGAKNGLNLSYLLPEAVVPDTMRLYRNGVRQKQGNGEACDFTLTESGGVGTGYDRIQMTSPPLLDWEQLLADYVVPS